MDDTSFRLLLGIAGVAFGAIQLYFRSELRRVSGLEKRTDKQELRHDTLREEVKATFQTHIAWVQRELEKFREKCEIYRNEIKESASRINGDAKMDAKEIVKIDGRIKLIDEKLGKVEQFFYEGKSLWETKAEMLERLDIIEDEIKGLKHKVNLSEVDGDV